jgi:hypothetical protein
MVPWEPEVSEKDDCGESGAATSRPDMRQSRMDPNRGRFNRGYCAVNIGGSCSESPETTTLPVELRDLRTSATDPSLSCPASSMKTQSTSNGCRLLNLYNCESGYGNQSLIDISVLCSRT